MLKIRAKMLLLVLMLVGVLSISMSSVASPSVTTLWFNTLFHSGDAQAMTRIVDLYNQTHTDTHIILTQGQWSNYYANLTNSVIAGNPPQIAITHINKLAEMYPALTTLDDTKAGNLLEYADIKSQDYPKLNWDAGERNGHRYLVPLDTHLWGLWYNKDIFKAAGLDPEKPPSTMAEFITDANAIKAAGYFAFHPAEDALPRKLRRAWYIFLWQQGGELFDKDYTHATFNTEQGIKALQFLVDIFHKYGWEEAGANGVAQFSAGKLGMLLSGNWEYWTAKQSGVNYGMAYIPKFFDKRVTWANGHNLVIPKQAAGVSNDLLIKSIKAIKWINVHSDIWGIYGGHIPAYKPALNSQALLQSDTWKKSLSKFVGMVNNGWVHYPINNPKGSELEDAIQVQIQKAVNGEISPAAALKQAEADVNRILQGG